MQIQTNAPKDLSLLGHLQQSTKLQIADLRKLFTEQFPNQFGHRNSILLHYFSNLIGQQSIDKNDYLSTWLKNQLAIAKGLTESELTEHKNSLSPQDLIDKIGLKNTLALLSYGDKMAAELSLSKDVVQQQNAQRAAGLFNESLQEVNNKYPKETEQLLRKPLEFNKNEVNPLFIQQLDTEASARVKYWAKVTAITVGTLTAFGTGLYLYNNWTDVIPDPKEETTQKEENTQKEQEATKDGEGTSSQDKTSQQDNPQNTPTPSPTQNQPPTTTVTTEPAATPTAGSATTTTAGPATTTTAGPTTTTTAGPATTTTAGPTTTTTAGPTTTTTAGPTTTTTVEPTTTTTAGPTATTTTEENSNDPFANWTIGNGFAPPEGRKIPLQDRNIVNLNGPSGNEDDNTYSEGNPTSGPTNSNETSSFSLYDVGLITVGAMVTIGIGGSIAYYGLAAANRVFGSSSKTPVLTPKEREALEKNESVKGIPNPNKTDNVETSSKLGEGDGSGGGGLIPKAKEAILQEMGLDKIALPGEGEKAKSIIEKLNKIYLALYVKERTVEELTAVLDLKNAMKQAILTIKNKPDFKQISDDNPKSTTLAFAALEDFDDIAFNKLSDEILNNKDFLVRVILATLKTKIHYAKAAYAEGIKRKIVNFEKDLNDRNIEVTKLKSEPIYTKKGYTDYVNAFANKLNLDISKTDSEDSAWELIKDKILLENDDTSVAIKNMKNDQYVELIVRYPNLYFYTNHNDSIIEKALPRNDKLALMFDFYSEAECRKFLITCLGWNINIIKHIEVTQEKLFEQFVPVATLIAANPETLSSIAVKNENKPFFIEVCKKNIDALKDLPNALQTDHGFLKLMSDADGKFAENAYFKDLGAKLVPTPNAEELLEDKKSLDKIAGDAGSGHLNPVPEPVDVDSKSPTKIEGAPGEGSAEKEEEKEDGEI